MSDSQNVKEAGVTSAQQPATAEQAQIQPDTQASAASQPAVQQPAISKKPAGNGCGRLVLFGGIGLLIVSCCIIAVVLGLAGVAALNNNMKNPCVDSSGTPCEPPVSSPFNPVTGQNPDGKPTPNQPGANTLEQVSWPSKAYYMIDCQFYEVTQAAATKITNISGFTNKPTNDYCSTGSFGEVAMVNSQFVLSVVAGSTGKKEAYYIDLQAKTAKNLPKPADVESPNVQRTDYAYSPVTNMTMVYQLVSSGDSAEPRLKQISSSGAEKDIVSFEERLAAGRGGITGDEVSIAYNSNGKYVLINDTTAGPISQDSSPSFVAVVEVGAGRRLANIEGLKARWISATKFVYQNASIMGNDGDQKLYVYDVTTESSSLLGETEMLPGIAQAIATEQGYLLTQTVSEAKFSTKLVDVSSAKVFELSGNPLAQRAGSAVYFFEVKKCEITDFLGDVTESKPGAVLCPMGDSSGGLYTYRLMRLEGGKTTVAAEFGVQYLF